MTKKAAVSKVMEMSPELYLAAVKGNVSIFYNQGRVRVGNSTSPTSADEPADLNRYFQSHTVEERNSIIHVSASHDQDGQSINFVKEAIERFPALVSQINTKGDNPLHVFAREGNKEAVELLVGCCIKNNSTTSDVLWRVKNLQGDTPLHSALKRGKLDVALFLINLDDGLASFVNHSNETPLHLAASLSSVNRGLDNGSNRLSTLVSTLPKYILHLLLEKETSSAYIRDVDGLTPLLRASRCWDCVPAVIVMLKHSLQFAEQRDYHGRTILHLMKLHSYEEWNLALKITAVKALKDEQDWDGNTPVHLAIRDSDFLKVRVLMECSANLKIKNKHGVSAWDLIETENDFIKNLKGIDRTMNGLMKKELYKAAVQGKINFLSQEEELHLVLKLVDGSNILHIAMSPVSIDQPHFVEKVLDRLPILLCQTNDHGDTPLHLAARRRTNAAVELLRFCKNSYKEVSERDESFYLYGPPWKTKNAEGNTPLHEALLSGNARFARVLLDIDDEVTWYVNNSNETPLHLCARYKQVQESATYWKSWEGIVMMGNEVDLLLSANISAACLRDVDGFTPLLRAAQSNQLELVKKILHRCPNSVEVCDFDGRTLLHHLPLKNERDPLLDISEVKALIRTQDHAGNTPLHLAIKDRNFSKVKNLVQKISEPDLLITNNDAESSVDLIKMQTEVPEKIRRLFLRVNPHGSIYGISEAETKQNVNTLLVIAVLLATITFAAAFTVPGGFDQNKGTPLLIRKAAFKVFLISDTWAMCCSMLALFALIWVMTGGTSESLKLIDLSIFSLQMSFYATTVAFMTGVYVYIATSSGALWMAVLVCVLCSCLMVFSLKPIILRLARLLPNLPRFLEVTNCRCRSGKIPCTVRETCSTCCCCCCYHSCLCLISCCFPVK